MTTNWFIVLLGYLEPTVLLVTVTMIYWRRLAGSWPSLTLALTVELFTDLALNYFWHTPHHYKAYFYTYWLTTAFQSSIRMWIMADIVKTFPGAGLVSSRVYLFAGTACTVMGLCSGIACYNTTAHHGLDIISTAVLLDRCVNIAWVTFIAVLLVGVKLFGFGWSPIGARIANGVFFRICAAAVTVEMMGSPVEWLRVVGNVLGSICSVSVFAFWAVQALRYAPEVEAKDNVAEIEFCFESGSDWANG